MAVGNIRGIVVDIGGNTGPLQAALQGVNQTSRDLQTELGAVNRALRLDPTNTDLLSQRQRLLADSITATSGRLEILRQAQEQFIQSGNDIDGSQYRALQREIATTEQRLQGLEDQAQSASGALSSDDAIDNLKKIGKAAAVTGAAVVTIGTGALLASQDYKSALNTVMTQTGLTDDSVSGFKQTLTSIYENNFGEGYEDIATAMATVNQQTGLTGEALKATTQNALLLRDTFGMDVTESVRGASMLMTQFGLDGTAAYNLIAQGAQSGLDKNGDLLDTLNEYSGTFKAQGFSAEEMFNMLSNASKSGIRDVDLAADAIKEFGIRSKDASDSSAAGFAAMGLDATEMTTAFSEGGETGKAAFEKVTKALFEMDDLTAQNMAGTALFGTQWEDLGIKGVTALVDMKGPIASTTDALSKINEIKYDTPLEALKGLGRVMISDVVQPIGEMLMPAIESMIEKLSGLSVWIEKNKTLLEVIGIAIGTLVIALTAYNVVAALTAITTGGMTVAAAAFGATVTFITAPITVWILAIGAVVAAGVLLSKHFSADAIPAVQLYGKETSDATQKAVGAYMDLDDKATKSLMSLNFSGKTVSKETADALTKNFDDMGTQIKAGMDKHYGESLKTMQDFFGKSSVLTEKEEAAALAAMTKNNEDKKKSIDDGEKRISEILTKASTEKRARTKEEQMEINAIQEYMKTNAVTALSDTELESKSILERMKNQAGETTALQAAEVVKNSLEQKDKAVANAEEEYNKTVQAIIRQRDETGIVTKEQADDLIKEAGRQKDESVTKATEMNNKVVEQAKLQAKDHVNQVDWTTGEVKTKWQAMVDTNKAQSDEMAKNMSAKWEEIKKGASEKWEEIKKGVGQKVEDMKKSVSDKMEEIRRSIADKWGEAQRYLANINLMQIGKDIINGLINGVQNKMTALRGAVEEMASSLPNWIKKILDIRSPSKVMQEIGQYTIDGLIVGIGDRTGEVGTAMDGIVSAVSSKAAGLVALGTSMGQDFTNSFRNSINYTPPRDGGYTIGPDGTLSGGVGSSSHKGSSSPSKSGGTLVDSDGDNRIDYKEYDDGRIVHYAYHEGGWVGKALSGLSGLFGNLKFDEVPAILQAGEFVLSREMINNIANLGNRISPTSLAFSGNPQVPNMQKEIHFHFENRGTIVGSNGMNEFAQTVSTEIARTTGLSMGGAW